MFTLRQLVRVTNYVLPGIRPMSAKAGSNVDLSVDNDDIATVTMQKMPVNVLDLEMLRDLTRTFEEVEKNKYKGMILTSASPTVFSAGLDLKELYKPEMERAKAFWISFEDMWLKLFTLKVVTAAAINGHAPAGGCILALSCEYRAMVKGRFTTGLNETIIGVIPNTFFIDTMRHTLPTREMELALISSKMYNADEALKVGLIDDTATDKADAVQKCREFIKKFDKIPPFARAATKQRIREIPIKRLHQNRKSNLEQFLESAKDEEMQNAIRVYFDKLKKNAIK